MSNDVNTQIQNNSDGVSEAQEQKKLISELMGILSVKPRLLLSGFAYILDSEPAKLKASKNIAVPEPIKDILDAIDTVCADTDALTERAKAAFAARASDGFYSDFGAAERYTAELAAISVEAAGVLMGAESVSNSFSALSGMPLEKEVADRVNAGVRRVTDKINVFTTWFNLLNALQSSPEKNSEDPANHPLSASLINQIVAYEALIKTAEELLNSDSSAVDYAVNRESILTRASELVTVTAGISDVVAAVTPELIGAALYSYLNATAMLLTAKIQELAEVIEKLPETASASEETVKKSEASSPILHSVKNMRSELESMTRDVESFTLSAANTKKLSEHESRFATVTADFYDLNAMLSGVDIEEELYSEISSEMDKVRGAMTDFSNAASLFRTKLSAKDASLLSSGTVQADEESEKSGKKSKKKKKKRGENIAAIADKTSESDAEPSPEEIDDRVLFSPASIPPKTRSIESLQHYFGTRRLDAFDNSEILRSRLFYQFESYRYPKCFEVANKKSGEVIGTIPPIKLEHVWRLANGYDARKITKVPVFYITEEQWEEDRKKLCEYLSQKREGGEVYVSDVLLLSEIEYEMIGLHYPGQSVALMQTAILGEIEQNKRIMATWKKIKNYSHKVNLALSVGGIFSSQDVRRLNRFGINYLNDLKRYNIYQIKGLILDHDFENIVKEINAAFKADLERRRDHRYKVYPFLAAFKNLAIIIGASYYYKYTLMDNTLFTTIIGTLLGLSLIEAVVIFIGGKRAKRRARIVPAYRYFTPKIKRSIALFAMASIFSIASLFVFYLRYDGYNDMFYYRDLDDGTISISTLRDPDMHTLNSTGIDTSMLVEVIVPSSIDGKRVTVIEEEAFSEDSFEEIILPDTLLKIGEEAFMNCDRLVKIYIPDNVTEVATGAFKDCTNLTEARIPATLVSIEPQTFSGTAIQTIEFAKGGEVEIKARAFEECYVLTDIKNMSSVKAIGERAFAGCNALNSVTFGDKLESIGAEAFLGCSKMTELHIPESVKSIGYGAFHDCNSLVKISLPFVGTSPTAAINESVTDIISVYRWDYSTYVEVHLTGSNPIGSQAFRNVEWIGSVNIGDEITDIREGAFSGAYNLRSVRLSSALTEISANLFKGCESLEKVSNTASVQKIGANAFTSCNSLQSFDCSNVTLLGTAAFSYCSNLSDVTLSDSLTAIPENCFSYSAVSFTSLPESVKTVGTGAFENCDWLRGTLDLQHVETVGASAFRNIESIVGIKFSDSLTTIGASAFAGCTGLETLLIPKSVTSVGLGAFVGCDNIRTLTVPFVGGSRATSTGAKLDSYYSYMSDANVYLTDTDKIYRGNFADLEREIYNLYVEAEITDVEIGAFDNSDISTINFPESLKNIPDSLFESNGYVSTVNAPGVESVGKSAFSGAKNLTYINFPRLRAISENAFKDCERLSQISVTGVTNVGDHAFDGCVNIQNLTFSSLLKTIGSYAFNKCHILSNVGYIANVTSIGDFAFANCGSLTAIGELPVLTHVGKSFLYECAVLSFTVPATLKTVGDEMFNQSYVQTVILSEGITSIGKNAFKTCVHLSDISLPSTLTAIGENAFYGCAALKNLNLTLYNIREIGAGAFSFCSSLTYVYLPTTITSISDGLFMNCSDLVYVNLLNLPITSIGKNAFYECSLTGMTDLKLPDSVTEIGASAFSGTEITKLTLFYVKKIGESAFADTKNLTSVTVPFLGESVSYSGAGYKWTFWGSSVSTITLTNAKTVYSDTFNDSKLTVKEIILNEGITSVEADAFNGCKNLSLISLPSTLKTIGNSAFEDCSSLTSITIPASVSTIGNAAFKNCTVLAEIELPVAISVIGEELFYNCKNLARVNFGSLSKLTKISKAAFAGTALTSVELLAGVTVIEESAFAVGQPLSMYINGSTLTMSKDAFGGYAEINLFVRNSTLQTQLSRLFAADDLVHVRSF